MQNLKKKRFFTFGLWIATAILLLSTIFVFAGCSTSAANDTTSTDSTTPTFNHQLYYFESSDNSALTTALSQPNKENKTEYFYIMSEFGVNFVSVSKSNVMSFESAIGSMSDFTLNGSTLTLKNTMKVTRNNLVFTATEIVFLPAVNKMQIAFTLPDSSTTATAIFATK